LLELEAAITRARLLTLTGVGGVGKTRLALAVGERVAGSFPDGLWFVDLAALADPALVLQAIAAAVSASLTPANEPLSALRNYLRTRHALLILDNCEHLLEGCTTLAGDLLRQCAHLRILTTSREPLGISGELRWLVPSLAAPTDEIVSVTELRQYAAVELFVTRAQSAMAHFAVTPGNAHTVGRICTRLDGIPLLHWSSQRRVYEQRRWTSSPIASTSIANC
jgi:non-specific serine/threonine protein kinase